MLIILRKVKLWKMVETAGGVVMLWIRYYGLRGSVLFLSSRMSLTPVIQSELLICRVTTLGTTIACRQAVPVLDQAKEGPPAYGLF